MPPKILDLFIPPMYRRLDNYSPKVFLWGAAILAFFALVSFIHDYYQIAHATRLTATVVALKPDPKSPKSIFVSFEYLANPRYPLKGTVSCPSWFASGLMTTGTINLVHNPSFPDRQFRIDVWWDAYVRSVALAGCALLPLLGVAIVIIIRLCYGMPALDFKPKPEPLQ